MSFQTFQVSGPITAIEGVVEFSEKYKEKSFVVKYDTSADYSYDAALTLANTKIGMIDDFKVGDTVIVHFNLSSRKVKENYYTKLNVWKIEHQR
jgi:hypothetical protein